VKRDDAELGLVGVENRLVVEGVWNWLNIEGELKPNGDAEGILLGCVKVPTGVGATVDDPKVKVGALVVLPKVGALVVLPNRLVVVAVVVALALALGGPW